MNTLVFGDYITICLLVALPIHIYVNHLHMKTFRKLNDFYAKSRDAHYYRITELDNNITLEAIKIKRCIESLESLSADKVDDVK